MSKPESVMGNEIREMQKRLDKRSEQDRLREEYLANRSEQQRRFDESVVEYYEDCRRRSGGGVTWVGD